MNAPPSPFAVGDYLRGRYNSNRDQLARIVRESLCGQRVCLWHHTGRYNWNDLESVISNYEKVTGEAPTLPPQHRQPPPDPKEKAAAPAPPLAEEAAANTAEVPGAGTPEPPANTSGPTTHHPIYGALRLPQARMVDLLENRIATGMLSRKSILAIVPPGHGKTLMASIFCHHMLHHGGVRYVLWVAPRISLCDQVQSGFHVPERGLHMRLGRWENGDRVEQIATDGSSVVGFVITNQTSMADLEAIVASFGGAPFLVVFDEFHHLKDKDDPKSAEDWTRKANYLSAQGNMTRRLLMSGTPWRHDGYGLPFLSEHRNTDGGIDPDVMATRREALVEQACLPLFFRLFDALVAFEWKGNQHQLHLSDASEDMAPKALEAFLKTEAIWRQCIDETIKHWARYREEAYPSRLIVVCATQDMARLVAEHMKSLQLKVALAISDDPAAYNNVHHFRTRAGRCEAAQAEVMVTVKMAYEGLDVPDVSHILYLSNIGTTQFLDQCFARATRVDRASGIPYEKQRAFVLAPATPTMQAYVADLKADQRDIKIEERTENERLDTVTIQQVQRSTFRVVGGSMSDPLEGDEDGMLTPEQNETVKRMRREFDHMLTWPPREILRLVQVVGKRVA